MQKINRIALVIFALVPSFTALASTIEVVSGRLFVIGRNGQLRERTLFTGDATASAFKTSIFKLPAGVRVIEISRYESSRINPLNDDESGAGLFLKGSDGLLYACPTEGRFAVKDRDGEYDAEGAERARAHNAGVIAKYDEDIVKFAKALARHTTEDLRGYFRVAFGRREKDGLGNEFSSLATFETIYTLAKLHSIEFPRPIAELQIYETDRSAEIDILQANEGCGLMLNQVP